MTTMLREWILSASALTAAVLLLRLLFRKRISQRLMYALWLPVLRRLLIPVSLYSAPVSVPAAAEQLAPAVFAAPELARPVVTAQPTYAAVTTPPPAPAMTSPLAVGTAPVPAKTLPAAPKPEPLDYARLLTGLGGAILLGFVRLWLLPFESWICLSAALTAQKSDAP